ncbi:hypothetical protein [Streptomyces sp. NPDC058145]|uniref:hypothetical protein n=1 Tax=Streptomyces sp. NPDC058145 TaxID=3346356 RepID=UPI0036E8B504
MGGAFVALVDDGFDRPGRPASSAEARAALNPLLAVLKGTSTDTDAPRRPARCATCGGAPVRCAYVTAAHAAFAEAT